MEMNWRAKNPDSSPIRMRLLVFRHVVNNHRNGPIQLESSRVSTECEYRAATGSNDIAHIPNVAKNR